MYSTWENLDHDPASGPGLAYSFLQKVLAYSSLQAGEGLGVLLFAGADLAYSSLQAGAGLGVLII